MDEFNFLNQQLRNKLSKKQFEELRGKDILNETKIRNIAIIQQFNRLSASGKLLKRKIIQELAETYYRSQATINSIVYRTSKRSKK